MQQIPKPPRKRPNHHPVIDSGNRSIIVFATVCTRNRERLRANHLMQTLLCKAWKIAGDWRVGAYVIMPDHIHLFCAPGKWPVTSLKRWVSSWKSLVARATSGHGPLQNFRGAGGTAPSRCLFSCNFTSGGPHHTKAASSRSTSLWQTDFWDTQLRRGQSYFDKWEYVRWNPVRAGLVETPERWPYQGIIHHLAWHD